MTWPDGHILGRTGYTAPCFQLKPKTTLSTWALADYLFFYFQLRPCCLFVYCNIDALIEGCLGLSDFRLCSQGLSRQPLHSLGEVSLVSCQSLCHTEHRSFVLLVAFAFALFSLESWHSGCYCLAFLFPTTKESACFSFSLLSAGFAACLNALTISVSSSYLIVSQM